jgi:DNA-binding transcriptional LysR family regulator
MPLRCEACTEGIDRLLTVSTRHRLTGGGFDQSQQCVGPLLHSDAVSMMPRFMAQAEVASGLLDVIPMPGLGLQLTLGAAWLRRRSMSGAGRKFVELLQAHDAALAAGSEGAPAKGRRARKQTASREA